MSLLTELDAFYTEHRRCGDLDGSVNGAVVWLVCHCDARSAPSVWSYCNRPQALNGTRVAYRRRTGGRRDL